MVTEGADKWFLCTVDCYMVLECLIPVGLVLTMSAMEPKNSCMGVLAIQHPVNPHISVSTLVTPICIISCMDFGMILQRCLRLHNFATFITWKFSTLPFMNKPDMLLQYIFVFHKLSTLITWKFSTLPFMNKPDMLLQYIFVFHKLSTLITSKFSTLPFMNKPDMLLQ